MEGTIRNIRSSYLLCGIAFLNYLSYSFTKDGLMPAKIPAFSVHMVGKRPECDMHQANPISTTRCKNVMAPPTQ